MERDAEPHGRYVPYLNGVTPRAPHVWAVGYSGVSGSLNPLAIENP